MQKQSCPSDGDDDDFLFVLAETKHSIKPYTLMGTLHQGIKRHM
jgi:hypothetical protein